MSQVIEINCPTELENYRLAWNALHLHTTHASFFQTLDWLQAYWRHYGERQRLRALVVCTDDKPIGVLPLCIRRERYKVGQLRVLTYPLHDWGTFYGPIGPNPTATLLAGLGHISRTRRDWDLVDLRWNDADRLDHGRTPRAMAQVGWRPLKDIWAQAPSIDLAGDWESYLASRTSKWRNNLKRHERRTADQGEIELVRYRPDGAAAGDDDPRWDLYDACETIAGNSWQGQSDDGTTLSHESVRSFFRETHEHAARLGMLDLNLLTVGEIPAAFAYNYVCQGRIIGMRIGTEPDFVKSGCGTVLYSRMIEDSFARGDLWYDMGVGSLEAKRSLQTDLANSYRYTHYPRRVVRAQALRLKRATQRWRSGEAKETPSGKPAAS